MIIEITRPELEAFIQERLKSGAFSDPQDVLLHAVRTAEQSDHQARMRAIIRSSPEEDAANAPQWLKDGWAAAKEAGLDKMSIEEIDAEIDAARAARRRARP